MLDRLLRPLRTGIVTSRYPLEPPLLAPATRQLPTLDTARCTRDGACVTACPTGAISLAPAAWTVDAGRCVFCGACALACPADAIRLDGGVTLAATTPAGLRHVTPLPVVPAVPGAGPGVRGAGDTAGAAGPAGDAPGARP